jgi:hypothetical protein
LLSNVLKDVVNHFRPLGIRLFVLSFNIVGHIWSQTTRRLVPRNSWVARTIDQLSREHDVVFVTITGNIPPSDVKDLLANRPYPDYLRNPMAKLLDPGHAALAVTVGSIAHSSRVVVAPGIPIARENQPSPFTRTGPGFDDSIKPDFVERGGNLVRDPHIGVLHNAGTNVILASNQLTPPLQHSHGTSFAAPRVANHLAVIARDLRPVDSTFDRLRNSAGGNCGGGALTTVASLTLCPKDFSLKVRAFCSQTRLHSMRSFHCSQNL